ncbi:MAG: DUF1236 domain-containing protein [Xanthobacteraceae bacterium]
MRKLLLTTVAAAALAGYTGAASAQTMQGPPAGAGAGTAAKTENTRPAESKGALSGALKGDLPGGHAQATSPDHAKSAQDASPTGKSDQKLGQESPDQKLDQKSDQKLGQDQPKGMTPPRNAEEEKPAAQQDSAKDSAKSGTNSAEQNAGKTTGAHGAVKLSQAQRTKIQTMIGKSSGARVSNVHFDVSVGVKIPSSVHVEVLPTEIVEVVPEFRGYDYIIVGDNILIIDPDSLEIVDIIAV